MLLAKSASRFRAGLLVTVTGLPVILMGINMDGWQARITSFIVALFLVALGVSVWLFGPWAFSRLPRSMQVLLSNCRPIAAQTDYQVN
jgi:hypothetical protein